LTDYENDLVVEGQTSNASPTSHAIAKYEAYGHAHLPRLVEEALEASVAEQSQPIEESLRRALASIVRDCQTRLARNFLRQRSSSPADMSVQAKALSSFYIEPLNLSNEDSLFDSTSSFIDGSEVRAPQNDSGYSSPQPLSGSDAFEVSESQTEPNVTNTFCIGHHLNNSKANEFVQDDHGWVEPLNASEDFFFDNTLFQSDLV
jgi:hypothetical protein